MNGIIYLLLGQASSVKSNREIQGGSSSSCQVRLLDNPLLTARKSPTVNQTNVS